jgi:hypothetical protein
MKDLSTSLPAMGLSLPSPAYLLGSLVFGLVGWAAYRLGRRAERSVPVVLGLVLMFFPYVVGRTWLLYGIGSALCLALVLEHRWAHGD